MKILLITPNFFDYPYLMCEELRGMGHEVDWYDDRPSTNSFVKAVIRINKNLINVMIENYFSKLLHDIENKSYDKVLLVSGQSLSFSEDMMCRLKNSQPQAEFVLYQWDSIKNFPYITKIQHFFNKCYSFDKNDVNNNPKLRFLPLFYSRSYEEIGKQKIDDFKFDLMFVGTAHPKKYKYVNEMGGKLKLVFPKQFIYFFFPSRIVYIYRKIRNHELRKAKYKEFHFTPISGKKMNDLLTHSKCVLDSAQDGQSGLTIRIIETLGAKRKIITTNADVVNYDFYKEENVYVYNGDFDFNAPFFTKKYVDVDPNIYEKYSLRNWLRELLG